MPMRTLNLVYCIGIVCFALWIWRSLFRIQIGFKRIFENFENGTLIEIKTIKTADLKEWRLEESAEYVKSRNIQEEEIFQVEKISDEKEKFYSLYAKYVSYSQMIAIFPLLGILGTVFGLALSGDYGDLAKMLSGLNVALYTTIAGLLTSILLRIYDAKNPGKMVNELDAKFTIIEEAIHMQTLTKELRAAGSVLQKHADADHHEMR